VISKVRPSFWRAYERLTPAIKGRDNLWSVRINEQYRAVGVRFQRYD